jgi:hypothetical protein
MKREGSFSCLSESIILVIILMMSLFLSDDGDTRETIRVVGVKKDFFEKNGHKDKKKNSSSCN